MVIRIVTALVVIAVCSPAPAGAQFRRGMLADSTEITLYPHDAPAILLPAGRVQVELKNATGAPARIVERMRDMLGDMGTSMVIGVRPPDRPQITTEYYSPWGAAAAACTQTYDIVKTTLTGIAQMIRGKASADQFRGPLGIAKMTRQVAVFGFLPLLNLVAILSVSIGLANLFPIPLLDGGHLLYYGCEAVLGRPLGERVQEAGFRFGLVLVIGLMIFSVWNDMVHHLNLF